MVEINLRNITCCRMNETCLHMNDVLWEYRQDLTTQPITMAIFSIFYTLIIIFGITGNLCVILAISRTRSLQTVPNMFIFSLSCSDIVVCCTSATITPITAFVKEWLFWSFLCSVAPFIAGVSLCFSTFTLAAISIDRFMLIRFPMKKPFSHAQASIAILLICILAAILSMPTMFTQTISKLDNYCGEFCYEDWGLHQSRRRAYGTVMLTLQFIIPLSIIIICYTAISVRLGQSLILKTTKKRDYDWQLQVTDQQRAANKRRQRTNRMFIGMVVAFSLSWFWSVLFNVVRDYEMLPNFAKQQEFFVGILTHCIAMTSTVWNPLLYAMLNFQLRAAFLQLMPDCIKETFCSKVSSSSSIPHDDITRRCKPPAITIANGNAKGSNNSNNQNNKKLSSTSLRPTTPSTLLITNNNAQGISTIDDDDDNYYNSDGTKYGSFDNASYFSTIIKHHPKSASFHTFSIENLQSPIRSSSTKCKEGFCISNMLSNGRPASRYRGYEPCAFENWEYFDNRNFINETIPTPIPSTTSRKECSIIFDSSSTSASPTCSNGILTTGASPTSVLRREKSINIQKWNQNLSKTTPSTPATGAAGATSTSNSANTTPRKWSQKAAKILGIYYDFSNGGDDDGRKVGWWKRRKSECDATMFWNSAAEEGNSPLHVSKRQRSASTRLENNGTNAIDDDGTSATGGGRGGTGKPFGYRRALMVPTLQKQNRSKSLTKSIKLSGSLHSSKHSIDTPRTPLQKLFSFAHTEVEHQRLVADSSSGSSFSASSSSSSSEHSLIGYQDDYC